MIKIENLFVKFGDKEVLKGLNLTIHENSVFGFIGRNGAGKTTTMKSILGMLEPDSGVIYVNGDKVVFGGENTNKYIGYLPDVPEFYNYMTAYEFLQFCAEITNMSKDEIKPRIKEILQLVGLENEHHYIKGFSRGMKQRLGIAQALLNKPKVLICDEPTSALDPIGRKQILDILKNISKETTVLFSTHILSDVEKICTDVAVLDEGIIKIHGKIDEIKEQYHKDEFSLELANKIDMELLLSKFSFIKQKEDNVYSFYAENNNLNDVLEFISANNLSLIKLEKNETSLETLFMEVIK